MAGRLATVRGWRAHNDTFRINQDLEAPADGEHIDLAGGIDLELDVLTDDGLRAWVKEADVEPYKAGPTTGIEFFLAFTGGDRVLYEMEEGTAVSAEVKGWTATDHGYGVQVSYRVHLEGAPDNEVMEADERRLALAPGI